MPADPTPSTAEAASVSTSPAGEPRSRPLMLALAALGVVSAVIAAVVIFYSGASTAPVDKPEAKVRTTGDSVVVGNPDAATKVVVHEDFGNRQSRDFETAS